MLSIGIGCLQFRHATVGDSSSFVMVKKGKKNKINDICLPSVRSINFIHVQEYIRCISDSI